MFVFNDDTRAGHETVCRSAVLRVRLSARPQGAGEPGSMPAAVAAHPRTS
jgi:hypothetical protein